MYSLNFFEPRSHPSQVTFNTECLADCSVAAFEGCVLVGLWVGDIEAKDSSYIRIGSVGLGSSQGRN
jgi:hypothetical protein